jgi:hypothetical protein
MDQDDEDSDAADDPDAADELDMMQRAPFGTTVIPMERYFAAAEHARHMPGYSTVLRSHLPPEAERGPKPLVSLGANAAALSTWSYLGPGNVGGRTRALLVTPQNPSVMFAAGVSGGIWKSVNAGASWAPLNDMMPNLAVGSMAMDPANPNVIYAGTGEYFTSNGRRGAGIFKTTDGGTTWNSVGNTATDSNFWYVTDVVVSPHNSQRVYAATSTGVWRSLDGGSTWAQIFDSTVNKYDHGCMNFAMRTDQPGDYLFVSCGWYAPAAVFRNPAAESASASTASWTQVLSDPHMGRTSLALATNQSEIYALTMCGSKKLCKGDEFKGVWAVYRSLTNGDSGSWTPPRVTNQSDSNLNQWLLTDPKLAAGCGNSKANFQKQGYYDQAIRVDPMNSDVVWVAGIALYRSDDGGANFGLANHWDTPNAANYAHSDNHVIVFHPQYNGTTNQTMYVGSDGGVFRTDNARAATAQGDQAPCNHNSQVNWVNMNNGYAVTQFHHGLPFPDGTSYFGGTQDNGNVKGTDAGGPNAWTWIFRGDGGYVAVDPANPSTIYFEPQSSGGNPQFRKSTDGGATIKKKVNGIEDGGFLFIPPFFMDPKDSTRLWAGGYSLWRTDDGADSWTEAGPNLQGDAKPFNQVSTIGQSPSMPSRVLVGTTLGTIYRLDDALDADANTPWTSSAKPRNGYVSSLAFDPHNSQIAYATYSSFNAESGATPDAHIYKSSDAGVTWSSLDGSGATAIPDIPVRTLVVDPTTAGRLYVGTDLGVFTSTDGGTTWAKENTGFANVPTSFLTLNSANGVSRLYAFTFGRGAWRVNLVNPACPFTLSPANQTFNATAGSGSLGVLTSMGCAWQATPDVTWVHITAPAGGTGNGNGTVSFTVDANTTNATRTGHINLGSQQFTVTQKQSSCTYSVSTLSTIPGTGGSASLTVTATAGCAWQASSSTGWITIASTTPNPGTGNGSVALNIGSNLGQPARSASILVAGINVTVSQAAGGTITGDEIASATLFNTFPYKTTVTTTGATANASDPVHTCSGNSADSASVWFRFVAPVTGTVQVSTEGSNYDTVLSAYQGTTSVGAELACSDDIGPDDEQSEIGFSVTAGQSYLIEVSESGSPGRGGTLVLGVYANDQSTLGATIGGTPFTASQPTGLATSIATDPVHSCTTFADSKTVWYRYTPTFTGNLMVDTQTSDYDTVLSVHPASNTGQELACNDDAGGTAQSAVNVAVTANTTYLIEASAHDHDLGGNLQLNVYGNDQPAMATPVTGLVFETTQFIALATASAADPTPSCAPRVGQSVWFAYTPTQNAVIRVNTFGSDYDTVVAVYKGSGTPGAEVACNDDSGGLTQSQVSFTAFTGQPYLIMVGSKTAATGSTGTLNFMLRPDVPCTYTLDSSSMSFLVSGGSDTFNVKTNYDDCPWTATPSAGFIQITSSPTSGTGTTTVEYTVLPNSSPSARTGTIAVGGQTFNISQAAAPAPDLVVTALSGPTSATAGGTINVSMTVANQGAGAAGTFKVEFYFSSTSTITTAAVDTGVFCTVNGLAAGASTSCSGSLTLPAAVSPGTWYLGAIADPAGTIVEASEGNNSRAADTGAVTVKALPPTVVSLAPTSGSGKSGTFTFVVSDPSGAANISSASLLVNAGLTGTGGCFINYNPVGSTILLANDTVSVWLGPSAVGSGAALSNSQCSVNVSGATATRSGNNLTVSVPVTFTATFTGSKTVWVYGANGGGNTGFQAMGTWTVTAPATQSKIGIFNAAQAVFLLDANGNFAWDGTATDAFFPWGGANHSPKYTILTGDWNGSGTKKIGIFDPATAIWLLDYNGDGVYTPGVDKYFAWGSPGDIPVVGDWNGSGTTKIGTFGPNTGLWLLDYNGNFAWDGAGVDKYFPWGSGADTPVVGDWNGSGTTKVGTFGPKTGLWLLDYNGNFSWDGPSVDKYFPWGSGGDTPIVGDWNGSGTAKVGTFGPNTGLWLLDYNGNFAWDGASVDKYFPWGSGGDTPVVGDWNGNGRAKVGTFGPGTSLWLLDYNGSFTWDGPSVDKYFPWGSPGDTPVILK